jgi:hypothetical protein
MRSGAPTHKSYQDFRQRNEHDEAGRPANPQVMKLRQQAVSIGNDVLFLARLAQHSAILDVVSRLSGRSMRAGFSRQSDAQVRSEAPKDKVSAG